MKGAAKGCGSWMGMNWGVGDMQEDAFLRRKANWTIVWVLGTMDHAEAGVRAS